MAVKDILTREDFVEAIEGPRCADGGYPLHFVMEDGETICWNCALENRDRIEAEFAIEEEHGAPADREWRPRWIEINYEDPYLACANCYRLIHPAYPAS